MVSINKVRRILKAQEGLQFSNQGLKDQTLSKIIQQLKTTPADFGNPHIMTPQPQAVPKSNVRGDTKNLFDRMGGFNTAGQITDLANNLLFSSQKSQNSALTNGLDTAWNMGSDIALAINPALGFGMKIGGLAANTLKALGTGTDQMTGIDKFSDSTLGQLTGIGIINGALGKKSRDFSADKSTIEQVGGSYGGLVRNINKAQQFAGKKYGLLSGGSRRSANRFIDKIEAQQSTMAGIAKEASDLSSIATNMSDLNHLQYGFNLNGGYDQRYMRAAKFGAKLKRVKRINFHKSGGEIKGVIDLDNWQPEITEAPIEWVPVITFKDGGKTEELPQEKEESKLEETTQKNVIPEGALHAHKHHMENSDGLTQKGIPVIDNDGDQQAEIEKNEIIFTLEVTKRLEELYSKYQDYEYSQKEKDEVAIEAGKLLVEEILFNTDDRTGLISTLKQGGKIDGIE